MMRLQVDPMASFETSGRALPQIPDAPKQRKNMHSWYPAHRPRPWREAVMRLLKLPRVALLIAVASLDICLSVKAVPVLYRTSFQHRTQAINGQFMKIKFRDRKSTRLNSSHEWIS